MIKPTSSGNDDGGDGDDDNGNDGDDDDKNTNTFFKDTGLSDSDGITNNNTITVDDLKAGETWRYSISC
jgi:hypothetical protein